MGERIDRQMSDLQLSEDKFRKMADHSPYPLFLINDQLQIVNRSLFDEKVNFTLNESRVDWAAERFQMDGAIRL